MTLANNRKIGRGQAGRIAARGALGLMLFVSLGGAQAQPTAKAPQAPPSLFAQHAQQAGVKACASVYPTLGAMVTEGAAYNVASSWNTSAPDTHPVRGLVGLTVNSPKYHGPGAGVVIAAPGPGGCGGGAVRIVPFPQPCAELAKQLPAGSKPAGDLSGTQFYEIGGGLGQVMLLKGQAGCIAISVNQIG